MLTLRAFLMLCIDGNWSVTVHKDIDSLGLEWKASDLDKTGVLHIGFDRLPAKEFDHLVGEFRGKLLLTPSARHALPSGYHATEHEVGWVGSMPIYLATRGWGYFIDTPEVPASSRPTSKQDEPTPVGWVREYLLGQADDNVEFLSLNILNDGEYLRHEAALSRNVRHRAGVFRLRELIGLNRDDPCAFARVAPPWLSERTFSSIPITVRVSNVLINLGVENVFDLGSVSLDKLLHTQNFGRKSVRDLSQALETALDEGPVTSIEVLAAGDQNQTRLIDAVEATLLKYPARTQEILRARMGFGNAPETLQEIGSKHSITRERVRQIEAKFNARVVVEEIWDDILATKLSKLLENLEVPLPLRGIEAADGWFLGIGGAISTFKYLLESVVAGSFQIITINGVEYVGRIDQPTWDLAVTEGRRLLDGVSDSGWDIDHCRAMVSAVLPESCGEFRDLLWDEASKHCQFADVDGIKKLVAFGRGVENIVQAVLNGSSKPLHFTVIASQAEQRAERALDIRRVHNAASNVGLLFGRGTYGLEKHIPVTPDDLLKLAFEAEEIIAEGIVGRQWHCQEITAALADREFVPEVALDKYIVDIALRKSGQCDRLGRLVWVAASDTLRDSLRIDVRQAVIAVLQNADGPLAAEEIRRRVQEMRGVDKNFQMTCSDPVLRIGPGLWGLNDRDLVVKRGDQPKILNAMASMLTQRGLGIHMTEMENSPSLRAIGLSPSELFSLTTMDARFRVSTSRYLFLDEWSGPRRESANQAVKSVLLAVPQGVRFELLVTEVESRIGRSCKRSAISGALQSLDAVFDETNGTWRLPTIKEIETANQDEEIFEAV